MSGSFDVDLDDDEDGERIHPNRSYQGLSIPTMVWWEVECFLSGSIFVMLASENF
jgi:hypothetical protein